jgi:hypothetical protein
MNAPDLSQLPYRRPPMTRGIDPQRMNWLWRLVCDVGAIEATEVVEALHATGVPVDARRVKSWVVSDREDSFFPITIAELERNLRAMAVFRQANANRPAPAPAEPAGDAPAADADEAAPPEW